MTDRRRGRARHLGGLAGRALVSVLLLAGAVLTTARLWQPAPGPLDAAVVRLASVVPAALPAYAAAAGGAALLLRRWRPARLLLVLAVLGLVLHGWWFAPMLAEDAPPAADGPRVRVLTVNALVHTGASGSELVDLGRAAEADVVVVEEVGSATMVWSRLPLRDLRPVPGASGCLRVTVRAGGRDLDRSGSTRVRRSGPGRGERTTPRSWPTYDGTGPTCWRATSTPPPTTSRCAASCTRGCTTPAT